MVQVNYSVEVLEGGRDYHDFELSCPSCDEKAIAVLDSKDKKIIGIKRGPINENGSPNTMVCSTCACTFKVKPKLAKRKNSVGELLRQIKFPKFIDRGDHGHIHIKHGKPKAKKAPKKEVVIKPVPRPKKMSKIRTNSIRRRKPQKGRSLLSVIKRKKD